MNFFEYGFEQTVDISKLVIDNRTATSAIFISFKEKEETDILRNVTDFGARQKNGRTRTL
jgi:hypothetical protein